MMELVMEELITGTEYLLREAQHIATRVLGDPSESAILDVFRQLCAELAEVPDNPHKTPVLLS